MEESARVFENILKNEGTPAQRQVVIVNAALALACARQIPTVEAVALATEALASGAAGRRFQKFMEINREGR